MPEFTFKQLVRALIAVMIVGAFLGLNFYVTVWLEDNPELLGNVKDAVIVPLGLIVGFIVRHYFGGSSDSE